MSSNLTMPEVMARATGELKAGRSEADVTADLERDGVHPKVAEDLVHAARQNTRGAVQNASKRMLVIGLGMLGGSLFVTLLTSATSGMSGFRVVAVGLIATGLVYTVVGLIRLTTGKDIR